MPDGASPTRQSPEFMTRNAPAPDTRADPEPAPSDPATEPSAADTATQIMTLISTARLSLEEAEGLIASGATVDQARAYVSSRLTRRADPLRHQRTEVGTSHDAPDAIVQRMTGALVARLTGIRPQDAERPYMGRRALDMAGELLALRGERVQSLTPDELLRRSMHTTDDFPTLLTGTGNRILLAAYEAAPNPLKRLARQTTIADFRAKTSVRLGGMSKLTKVSEHGELTAATRSEAKESYRLATFGKTFSLTREAIINDDLNAFGDLSAAAGRAAAETEASELVDLLLSNTGTGPTMDDGNPLFHTSHGNVAGSGAAIDTTTTLPAARLAMRTQTGLAGEPINATPKFLLVSPAKETEAEKVLATLYPTTVTETNPFAGRLELMVEARLTGNRWWLFADPATLPVLEYAYLTSAPGPQIATRDGWDILGLEMRVTLDFGCGAIDWRGAYTNAGN